jgi:hypothetical protein
MFKYVKNGNTYKKNIFINVFFICALFPFVAPVPAPSDVQYPIFVMSFILVFFLLLKGVRVDRLDVFFFVVAVVSVFYINPFGEFDLSMKKAILMPVSFIVFFIARRCNVSFSYRVYVLSVTVSFIAALIHLLYPELFVASFGHLVRVIKVVDLSGARGVSGLSPEPSFLGAMGVFYILLGMFFYEKKRDYIVIVYCCVLSILMIILSRSGTGYLYLVIIIFSLAVDLLKGWKLVGVFALATMILFFLLNISYREPNRGFEILMIIYNEGPAALLNDASVYFRIKHLILAFNSFWDYPFGNGLGSYLYVAEEYGVDVEQSLSALAKGLVELGIWFALFLAVVFLLPSTYKFSFSFKVLAGIFLIASFSFAFPPTWLLLGIVFSATNIGVPTVVKLGFLNSDTTVSVGSYK